MMAEKMRECYVRLDKAEFKKIHIKCTAKRNEDEAELKCNVKQTGANSFTIRIGN